MSAHATPLLPGTSAPDFELPSTPDQTVSLADFRGQPVILAFYPEDWSPVCSELDVGSFGRELTEHVHAARVHEDFLSGVRSGVNGTPTLFINGARHDDSYEFETLLSALRRAAA
jgi:AhpC/TSA family